MKNSALLLAVLILASAAGCRSLGGPGQVRYGYAGQLIGDAPRLEAAEPAKAQKAAKAQEAVEPAADVYPALAYPAWAYPPAACRPALFLGFGLGWHPRGYYRPWPGHYRPHRHHHRHRR